MRSKIFNNRRKLLEFGAKIIHNLWRGRWQDYVDLYYVFQRCSLTEVIKQARNLFKGEINERMVREQLNYFAGINYSEPIEYLSGMAVEDGVIKKELKKIAVS